MKTVRVRILVAVDHEGNWVSFGNSREDDRTAKDWISVDDLVDGEIYHWVEADIPLPTEAAPVIEGVVEADHDL